MSNIRWSISEEQAEMKDAVEMAIQTNRNHCNDKRQLTEDEFYDWTPEQMEEAYRKLFENSNKQDIKMTDDEKEKTIM